MRKNEREIKTKSNSKNSYSSRSRIKESKQNKNSNLMHIKNISPLTTEKKFELRLFEPKLKIELSENEFGRNTYKSCINKDKSLDIFNKNKKLENKTYKKIL